MEQPFCAKNYPMEWNVFTISLKLDNRRVEYSHAPAKDAKQNVYMWALYIKLKLWKKNTKTEVVLYPLTLKIFIRNVH